MPDATTPISPALTIQFGRPNHGWLPVSFQAGSFTLELEVSDAPINPLDLLCEALIAVPPGGSSKVSWYLEPSVYWFEFQPEGKSVLLTITKAIDWKHEGICILRLIGSVKDILMPFYKALKDFSAQGYRHPHWPSLARNRIAQAGEILHAYR